MRRVLIALVAVFVLAAGRAEAVTIRDLIELSKAGLGDEVLIALIEVDRQVFNIDTATLKKMKEAGRQRDGHRRTHPERPRRLRVEPAPAPVAVPDAAADREPEVIVIDHRDAPPAPHPSPTRSRGSCRSTCRWAVASSARSGVRP